MCWKCVRADESEHAFAELDMEIGFLVCEVEFVLKISTDSDSEALDMSFTLSPRQGEDTNSLYLALLLRSPMSLTNCNLR